MMRKIDELTMGYENKIDFTIICNDDKDECPFKLLIKPDKTSLSIIYKWINETVNMFNDREEAFYIDDISPLNFELAKSIASKVYDELKNEYYKDNNQVFNMKECVNKILLNY